jgi:Ankyrin repeats (3 copies)
MQYMPKPPFANLRLGKKRAQEAKETEHFAQQAQKALSAVIKSGEFKRCPECHHCQSLGSLVGTRYTRDSSAASSIPPLPSPIETEVYGDIDPANSLKLNPVAGLSTSNDMEFYFDSIPLNNIGISPTFNACDASTAFTSTNDWPKDLLSGAISPKRSNQVATPFAKTSLPPNPVSRNEDVGAEQLQQIAETNSNRSLSTAVHKESIGSASELSQTKTTVQKHDGLNQMDVALHLAASQGNGAIISILLRSGAGVNSRDGEGQTPLQVCAEHGHIESMEVLLASGADPNKTNSEGFSIMLAAVKAGKEKVVEVLVRNMKSSIATHS